MRVLKVILIAAGIISVFGVSPVTAGKPQTFSLIKDVIATSDKPASAEFQLPAESKSAVMTLTAYNNDPVNRRTVHFDIDGTGADIAYFLTDKITDGYIPPKQYKTWTIDLGKTYRMILRRWASYSVVEDQTDEIGVNYIDILRKPEMHKINCWVSASNKFAPGSKISVSITSSDSTLPSKKPLKSVSTKYIIDNAQDIRIKLALAKLRDAVVDQPYNSYIYVAGTNSALKYVSNDALKSLGKDGYMLKSVKRGGQRYVIAAGNNNQGIAYGIVRIARIISSKSDDLSNLSITAKPAYPIREMYEERPWCTKGEITRYKNQMNRYFEEAVNIADMWMPPLGPDPVYLKDFAYTPPYGDKATFTEMVDYAHSLGIRSFIVQVAQSNPLADIPVDKLQNIGDGGIQKLYSVTPGGGNDPSMLCASNPKSVEILKKQLVITCSTLKNIDGFVPYFADPGGCWCKDCRPWGKTIIRFMNEVYAPVIKSTNPKLKVILSLWGVDIDDVRYVAEHVDELPDCVTAMQIPPTSMVSGKYMTFENRVVPLIKRVSKKMPVILQQFYDGVGYRDAWVDIWEHPMPVAIKTHLQNTDQPHGTVKGIYGSAFRLSDQLVDLRLNMSWAWDPNRSVSDILTEYGNEHFGSGTGKMFENAMSAMENYWNLEPRRFHYDVADISEYDMKMMQKSLDQAKIAENNLRKAEPLVTKNKLYYRGFVELAELMNITVIENMLVTRAWRMSESGDQAGAKKALSDALSLSERVVDIMSSSDRYAWLTQHSWWKVWSISSRPESIRRMLAAFDTKVTWKELMIDDPSFENQSWKKSGDGKFAYDEDSYSGKYSARLISGPNQEYIALHQVKPLQILPNIKYKVTFWAKVSRGNPVMYLDWASPEGSDDNIEGLNSYVKFKPEAGWQMYTVYVPAPGVTPNPERVLRFIAHDGSHEVLIDDVRIYGLVSE
ncbi:MAG: alpha-glucuronidase family glycosyl hydrolase [Armatimonadota bacterium]